MFRTLRGLLKRWGWIVVATTLTGLAAAALVIARAESVYTTTATISLTPIAAESLSDALQGANFADRQAENLRALATSPAVLAKVAQGVGIAPTDLAKEVSARVPEKSGTIVVSARANDAAGVIQRANLVAQSIVEMSSSRVAKVNGRPAVAASLSMPAQTAELESGVSKARIAVVLGGLGFLAGSLLVALLNLFDTRIRRRDQLEEVTGAPTLMLDESRGIDGVRDLDAALRFGSGAGELLLVASPTGDEVAARVASRLCDLEVAAGGHAALVSWTGTPRPAEEGTLDLRAAVEQGGFHWPDNRAVATFSDASGSLTKDLAVSGALHRFLTALNSGANRVLVAGPGLADAPEARALAGQTGEVLLVVPHGTDRRAIRGALSAIGSVGARLVATVFVR